MKIFNTTHIKSIDQYTIQHEPISSINLMERAAEKIVDFFLQKWDKNTPFLLLAGNGNNGGDGLAIARMLLEVGYTVNVILFHTGKLSPECATNKKRLNKHFSPFLTQQEGHFIPFDTPPAETIIVDALFGIGVSRPISGFFADIIHFTNQLPHPKVAIDLPSGLFGDTIAQPHQVILQANYTLTIQFPKLALFFAENEPYIGTWHIIDIELHPQALKETPSSYHYITPEMVAQIHKKRKRFSHKGSYGHLLLYAGSKGMAGAALLATKAALRTGAGLVTLYSTQNNRMIAQTSIPEAIFTHKTPHTTPYDAIGVGCGIGKKSKSIKKLHRLLSQTDQPLVLDADALNIIAQERHLLHQLPHNSILTPHPKEFERLFGTTKDSTQMLSKAIQKAKEHQLYIVLKTAYSIILCPNGECYFNTTGNAGMATGGMGDVLTGIITSLMAQGYTSKESAILGVYLHGMAGDIALHKQSQESLLPSDLIKSIGSAFEKIASATDYQRTKQSQ